MTMRLEQIHKAASTLWNAWESGAVIPELPAECRPATAEEGHAIQQALAELSGQTVAGWKIAATSPAGQGHLNVKGPLASVLFSQRILRSGAAISLKNNRMRVAEAEFAFRLGEDLPPRGRDYTIEEVMPRVEKLHQAIEVPDSRYSDFTRVGGAQLIADNACACWFVLGREVSAGWQGKDLATHAVSLRRNGEAAGEGTGANVLGDPRIALVWLVNDVTGRKQPLRAGQIVTTGTCVTLVKVDPNDEIVGDFGKRRSVNFDFAHRANFDLFGLEQSR